MTSGRCPAARSAAASIEPTMISSVARRIGPASSMSSGRVVDRSRRRGCARPATDVDNRDSPCPSRPGAGQMSRKAARKCDDPRQGGLAGVVSGSAPGGRAEPSPDVVRAGTTIAVQRPQCAPLAEKVRGRNCSCPELWHPRLACSVSSGNPAPPPGGSAGFPRRRLLRPGQDDHCGVECAGFQPTVPTPWTDHPAGGAAQRIPPAPAHAGRGGRGHDGAAAPATHRAVYRAGRSSRSGPSSPRRCTRSCSRWSTPRPLS